MPIQRLAAAAAFLLLLTGCLPVTSSSPVGTTAGLAADPALFGSWKVVGVPDQKEAPPVYLHFLKNKDGKMVALYVGASGKADGKDDGWMAFDCSTAVLGANRYLNATATTGSDEDDGLKGRNIPFLYTLMGKTLTILWIDDEKAEAAIKAGEIEGKIEGDKFTDVTLTAALPALDAFFAKPEAAKLFNVMMVLKKVK